MDPTCAWECGAGNVTDGESHVTIEHVEDEGNSFCNGAGTDMFMQGFQVENTCHQLSLLNDIIISEQRQREGRVRDPSVQLLDPGHQDQVRHRQHWGYPPRDRNRGHALLQKKAPKEKDLSQD